MDVSYHEHCVQCCACGDRLHHTCFIKRTPKLCCKLDYDRQVPKHQNGTSWCRTRTTSTRIVTPPIPFRSKVTFRIALAKPQCGFLSVVTFRRPVLSQISRV
ncbi:hypothetical protein MTP99_008734 [Tenebrio molitor]|nr:hypothetical protein MTP99_008734 [Tenebrio molitor]